MKKIIVKCLFFVGIVAAWLFVGYIFNTLCFGGVRRNPPRYKIAPTNVIERIDGTNCYVRYMRDNLLNTNLVVACEPFDPAPAVQTDNTNEGESDEE